MKRMLQYFITKEVGLQYTAVRQTTGKENLKHQMISTEFYNCMKYIITTAREEKNLEISEKIMSKGLSDVICNIKDWGKKEK